MQDKLSLASDLVRKTGHVCEEFLTQYLSPEMAKRNNTLEIEDWEGLVSFGSLG